MAFGAALCFPLVFVVCLWATGSLFGVFEQGFRSIARHSFLEAAPAANEGQGGSPAKHVGNLANSSGFVQLGAAAAPMANWSSLATPAGRPRPERQLAAEHHAALLIIGTVRTLVWPSVCKNARDSLVQSLQRSGKWKLHIFLFISLVDEPRNEGSHVGRSKEDVSRLLKPCVEMLKPVHVEHMPRDYPPRLDVAADCQAPYMTARSRKSLKWKAVFSQCARKASAYDYVRDEYEKTAGVQFSAFIYSRPDNVYVKPVPDLETLFPGGSVNKVHVSMSKGDHLWMTGRPCWHRWHCNTCHPAPEEDYCQKPNWIHDIWTVIGREQVAQPGARKGKLSLECDRLGKTTQSSKNKGICTKFAAIFARGTKPPKLL